MSKINVTMHKITMIITNKKTIDISNETLIETFSIFQITNSQFDYFFIELNLNLRSFDLLITWFWQSKRKLGVVSGSEPQPHKEFIVPRKLCLNLCLLRWLKFSLKRVSNLMPLFSWIAKKEFSQILTMLTNYNLGWMLWWYSSALLSTENTVFGQIWSKKVEFSV